MLMLLNEAKQSSLYYASSGFASTPFARLATSISDYAANMH